MTPEEEQEERFAQTVIRVMDKRRDMSEPEHKEHHEWIKAKKIKEEKMAEFWEAMKMHVLKWGILGSVSWIGYALWYYFIHTVKGDL